MSHVVHGYVTEKQTPPEYVPDTGTTDPAALLIEREIQVRYLRRLVIRLEEELADRDKTIHELICDLVAERQRHSQADTPSQP